MCLTSGVHIVKYTQDVAFCCISFRSLSFLLSHECVHMGPMDCISSIFVRFFFQNYLGIIDHWSHVTEISADQSPLLVHSTLIRKQWKHSDQRAYLCVVWSCYMYLYQIAFWDKQCNFWPGYNIHVQPGQCFLTQPINNLRETSGLLATKIQVTISFLQVLHRMTFIIIINYDYEMCQC